MTSSTSIQLGTIGQVSLSIRDVASAERFYGETLGLPHVFTFGDLAFFDFAINRTEEVGNAGSYVVSGMPETAPTETAFGDVLVLSCKVPTAGLYRMPDLRAPSFGPKRGRYPPPITAVSDATPANDSVTTAWRNVEPRLIWSNELSASNENCKNYRIFEDGTGASRA